MIVTIFFLYRDVLNVLTFSLNTAEQSLVELQPHVVAKLIEGRNRRVQTLEQTFKAKMKDVEQRSSETCAVNSQHLEQFQKKAQQKLTEVESQVQTCAQQLLDMFQPSPSLTTSEET